MHSAYLFLCASFITWGLPSAGMLLRTLRRKGLSDVISNYLPQRRCGSNLKNADNFHVLWTVVRVGQLRLHYRHCVDRNTNTLDKQEYYCSCRVAGAARSPASEPCGGIYRHNNWEPITKQTPTSSPGRLVDITRSVDDDSNQLKQQNGLIKSIVTTA